MRYGSMVVSAEFCPPQAKGDTSKPPATGSKERSIHRPISLAGRLPYPPLSLRVQDAGGKISRRFKGRRQPWRFHLGVVIILYGVDDATNPFCGTKRLCSCRRTGKLHQGGTTAWAFHRNAEPDGARAGRSSRRAAVEPHHAQRRTDRCWRAAARTTAPAARWLRSGDRIGQRLSRYSGRASAANHAAAGGEIRACARARAFPRALSRDRTGDDGRIRTDRYCRRSL